MPDSLSTPVSDLNALLRSMAPVLHEGVYVFACLPEGVSLQTLPPETAPLATFREKEGLSVIVEESTARRLALAPLMRTAWITLEVHSALDAVGFTAVVSHALTRVGISCNVVAAGRHDHLFVPVERGAEALMVLEKLQHENSAPVPDSSR